MHNVYVNYIVEYHDKIERGQIIAGKWIKKIYKILVDGIKSGDWDFDAKKANKAIQFIENFCHHSKGRNDLFKLELWQKAIVSAIFGILDKKTHRRQFREIFLLVGRKNGKSLFAAAIMAYVAYIDGEYGSELYCLAPKLDQADIVYDSFYKITQAEEELAEVTKKRRSDSGIKHHNQKDCVQRKEGGRLQPDHDDQRRNGSMAGRSGLEAVRSYGIGYRSANRADHAFYIDRRICQRRNLRRTDETINSFLERIEQRKTIASVPVHDRRSGKVEHKRRTGKS